MGQRRFVFARPSFASTMAFSAPGSFPYHTCAWCLANLAWRDPVELARDISGFEMYYVHISSTILLYKCNGYWGGKEQIGTMDVILTENVLILERLAPSSLADQCNQLCSVKLLHEPPTLTSPHSSSGVWSLWTLAAGLSWWEDHPFGTALEASSSMGKHVVPFFL